MNASKSSVLEIRNCSESQHPPTLQTCNNMDIYCPDNSGCVLKGNSKIENSTFKSMHGFTHFELEPPLTLDECTMFCGLNGYEYNCAASLDGRECNDGTICNPEALVSLPSYYYDESRHGND